MVQHFSRPWRLTTGARSAGLTCVTRDELAPAGSHGKEMTTRCKIFKDPNHSPVEWAPCCFNKLSSWASWITYIKYYGLKNLINFNEKASHYHPSKSPKGVSEINLILQDKSYPILGLWDQTHGFLQGIPSFPMNQWVKLANFPFKKIQNKINLIFHLGYSLCQKKFNHEGWGQAPWHLLSLA